VKVRGREAEAREAEADREAKAPPGEEVCEEAGEVMAGGGPRYSP
jgi:hypothetical protein